MRRDGGVGSPGAVDASIGAYDVTGPATQRVEGAEQLAGRRLRGWVASSASSPVPRRRVRTSVTGPACRSGWRGDVVVTVLAPCARGCDELVGGQQPLDAGTASERDVGHLDPPGAAGHRLLERLGAGRQRGRGACTSMPSGRPAGSRGATARPSSGSTPRRGRRRGTRLGFVAGRQRQPEAEPGPGREALGVGDADAGASQLRSQMRARSRWLVKRTLPSLEKRRRTRCVALTPSVRADMTSPVRAPPAWTDRHRRGPGERSWPVPWLPPAGGVAEATTCSMP